MEDNKSYSESKDVAPIDWWDRLMKSEYSDDELNDMCEDASRWTTCACGNQCAIIPRSDHGVPEDEELEDLGCQFADRIHEMRDEYLDKEEEWKDTREQAKWVLSQIEVRSQLLIIQIRNNERQP